jgi:PhoH-like ATPase
MTRSKRIYVLDTNVLMHDPTALFKFEEHDVYLPMQVIEELDNAKKGLSEVSRNARQVSRFINELIEANGADKIGDGLKLVRPQGCSSSRRSQIGKLRFQTAPVDAKGKLRQGHARQPDPRRDHGAARGQRRRAGGAGVQGHQPADQGAHRRGPAEDYENDRALDDFNLLYTGATELPADFWQKPRARTCAPGATRATPSTK